MERDEENQEEQQRLQETADGDVPPYSVRNELRFFFHKGTNQCIEVYKYTHMDMHIYYLHSCVNTSNSKHARH